MRFAGEGTGGAKSGPLCRLSTEDEAIAVETGLQSYLKQIDDAPLLTAEEERELGREIQYAFDAPELFVEGKITLVEKEEAEARPPWPASG